MKLKNTLTREEETVVPITKGIITMYNCGPTVYWNVHIGNLRADVIWDVLARFIRYNDYELNRIMNFTDVGHMFRDEDFGEDKVESRAKEENRDPIDIANEYIEKILNEFRAMNIQNPDGTDITGEHIKEYIENRSPVLKDGIYRPADPENKNFHGWVRAVDHVPEMIEIVKKIEANGFTYETDQAVYFDVTKYPNYTKLSGQNLDEKIEAARDEVEVDPKKKHAADFVLWMKRTGKYTDHIMHWDSPWGDGFPGWHIECTAMASTYLGDRFDIHTGGVDHIGVHHTNERAQSYGAFGHDGSNFWVHNEMLVDKEGRKASKSKKNVFFMDEVKERGFGPMDMRYYFLTANFTKPMAFSWDALEGAKSSRESIVKDVVKMYDQIGDEGKEEAHSGKPIKEYIAKFKVALSENINTARALSVLQEVLDLDAPASDRLATVFSFDEVLGLGLSKVNDNSVEDLLAIDFEKVENADLKQLLYNRQSARESKDFHEADKLRDQIQSMGYEVIDTSDGQKIRKIK